MELNIKNQIEKLVKQIEKPLNDLDSILEDYRTLEGDLEFPESSGEHFETACEFDNLDSYKQELESTISKVLEQITILSDDAIYDDPIAYLKPFIKVPLETEEIILDII